MNVLVYGGSFNPIHYAHINNIKLAIEYLKLDKIILVCDKYIHFKDKEYLLEYDKRIDLIKMALKEYQLDQMVEVSLMLKDDTKIRYTYDVIKEIKKDYVNDKLYFLIGSDQANQLNKWQHIDNLKSIVEFIITKRDNNYKSLEYQVIDNEILTYSSTKIRNTLSTSGISSVDQEIRSKGYYLESLLNNYLSQKRVIHSTNVGLMAKKYALKYQLDYNKAYVAGLLHDICKEMPLHKQYEMINKDECFLLNDNTIHAYSSAILVRDVLKIEDNDIYQAIKYHTTAYYHLAKFSRLIYVCDKLSYERDYDEVSDLRKILDHDLDLCYCKCVMMNINYLKNKGIEINNELKVLEEQVTNEYNAMLNQ